MLLEDDDFAALFLLLSSLHVTFGI